MFYKQRSQPVDLIFNPGWAQSACLGHKLIVTSHRILSNETRKASPVSTNKDFENWNGLYVLILQGATYTVMTLCIANARAFWKPPDYQFSYL